MKEQLPSLKSENQKNSIFDFYSIENEISFIEKNGSLSFEDKNYYLKESVLRFLGEFAGKIPYTKISYFQENDQKLYSKGLKKSASEIYKENAEKQGKNSREEADYIGFSKIEKAFINGSNFAYWISPPSNEEGFGDYGFAFILIKNNKKIDEYIVRYDEKRGSLDESNKLIEGKTMQSALDFLKNPFFSFEEDANQSFQWLLNKKLNFSSELIYKSKVFEEVINQELSSWIDLYSKAINKKDIFSAKKILTAIYNRAVEINNNIENYIFTKQEININQKNKLTYLNEHLLLNEYSKKHAYVFGGGSCPTSSNESLNMFASGINYQTASLITGKIEESNKKWEYHTGNCVCCGAKNTEVGPCKVCKKCEKKFNKDELNTYFKKAA